MKLLLQICIYLVGVVGGFVIGFICARNLFRKRLNRLITGTSTTKAFAHIQDRRERSRARIRTAIDTQLAESVNTNYYEEKL